MQLYSVQFRNTILQKMIGPEKRKAADLSEEFGVSAATIYGWKSKLKDGTLSVMENKSTSHERIPSEKPMLLPESKNIVKQKWVNGFAEMVCILSILGCGNKSFGPLLIRKVVIIPGR